MHLIKSSTKITFHTGAAEGYSVILFAINPIEKDKHTIIIFTEETPFHPRNYLWPDQPNDIGFLKINDIMLNVIYCSTVVMNKNTGKLILDEEELKKQKVAYSNPDYIFLVAHIVKTEINIDIEHIINQKVYLHVNYLYRNSLSKMHTANHFASLALNAAVAKFWRKPCDKIDSLGNYDLDAKAITYSKITETKSIDHYHLGKSLQKKGFNREEFLLSLEKVNLEMDKQLDEWTKNELIIRIEPEIAYLNTTRKWFCELPDGKVAKIFCGGTHKNIIYPKEKILVKLEKTVDQDFIIYSSLN